MRVTDTAFGWGRKLLVSLFISAMLGAASAQEQIDALDAGSGNPRTVRHVANNGVDSETCGSRTMPCRSITQGIVNAVEGDLVLVGPGLYGDLDDNCSFVFPGPGEERGSEICRGPMSVCLNKAVTVASSAGAAETVIDACDFSFAVAIFASNSTFGLPHRGFTLINATGSGVQLEAPSNARVAGNVIRMDPTFRSGVGVAAVLGEGHQIVGNVVRESAVGFLISGLRVRVTDNVAASNTVGAVGNFENIGFHVTNLDTFVARNSSVGNDIGMFVRGAGHVIRLNSIIGNRNYGIRLADLAPELTPIVIRRNNIFGNNNVELAGNLNCGIANETSLTIDATKNYWGARTGPGPDPADQACDISGGRIIHTPFATKQIPILRKTTAAQAVDAETQE